MNTTVHNKRVSDDDIRKAYRLAPTLRVGAQLVGLCPQSFHERVKRLIPQDEQRNTNWTAAEIQRLRDYYTNTDSKRFSIKTIAKRLQRPYSGVALMASRLGLTQQNRPMSDEHHRKVTEANHERCGSSPFSQTKKGRRSDLGDAFFRSAWEANYARYLNLMVEEGLIWKWEYEPETYWFHKIKRGTRSYLPDFKVWPIPNAEGIFYLVEVKGYMDPVSKTKLKRMRRYYPHITLLLLERKVYRRMSKIYGELIPNWEFAKSEKK